jgi:uncharacterized protein (DUF2062 family)
MKNFFKKIIPSNTSPQQAAVIITLGAATAVSPFWGIQTWLLFPISWFFKINPAGPIALLYLINNPWTMLPLAAADYYVGWWFTHAILHIDLMKYNPSWMNWVNNKVGNYLMKYLGIQSLSLWSFIIGGIILSIIVAAIVYPTVFFGFKYYKTRKATS